MTEFDFDQFSDANQESAYGTLDKIREGGVKLVSRAETQLQECITELVNGNFDVAMTRVSEATDSLQRLASAQSYLAAAINVDIVEAKDLQPGMLLVGWGRISEIDTEPDVPYPDSTDSMLTLKFEGERKDKDVPSCQGLHVVKEKDH